jgi:uncharacterized FAD-dependent dehydrogenase
MQVDVIVVGAGIAGLSAAVACHRRGLHVAVLDRGPDIIHRDRANPDDIASGVGGAGLFSDGKFSFFPSASGLWRLEPRSDLLLAYDWFSETIGRNGVEPPPFPEILENVALGTNPPRFIEKDYDSQYMPLASRLQMIKELSDELGAAVHTFATVQAMSFGTTCVIEWTLNGKRDALESRAAILGTGRLGPLLLQDMLPSALQRFERLEIGVRIEQPAERFFLREAKTLDPKRIWVDLEHHREWRTFCCCREGEVVSVRADHIVSVSGRSDVPPTGRSSVGFHMRMLDPQAANLAWDVFRRNLGTLISPVSEPLTTFLEGSASSSQLRALLGPTLASGLDAGLRQLLKHFPRAADAATLHGPAVEGVVSYPAVSRGLRVSQLPLWVAGDASGAFRGITAAGVSGYFAGIGVSRFLGSLG